MRCIWLITGMGKRWFAGACVQKEEKIKAVTHLLSMLHRWLWRVKSFFVTVVVVNRVSLVDSHRIASLWWLGRKHRFRRQAPPAVVNSKSVPSIIQLEEKTKTLIIGINFLVGRQKKIIEKSAWLPGCRDCTTNNKERARRTLWLMKWPTHRKMMSVLE